MFKSMSLVLCLWGALVAAPAVADSPVGAWAKVNASALNVRSTPSLHGEVNARIQQDETVFVTPSGQPGWVFVRGDESIGYVFAEYLRIIRVTSEARSNRRVGF
jgi:uncharacterized protein YgiM (DUF1202 family)